MGEGGTDLENLEAAIHAFMAREDRSVDLKALREVIDGLKYDLFFQEWTSENHGVRAIGQLERDRS